MEVERYERVKELFHAALEIGPESRAAFLEEKCAGDPALYAEVQSLIEAHAEADSILEIPAPAALSGSASDPGTRTTHRPVIGLPGGGSVGPYRVAEEGAPGERIDDEMSGTRLGRYRIIEKIGQGGMGHVYRAHDERLQRDVALKLLPELAADNPRAVLRFRQEALALSKLNHPNIASVYDFDSDDDGTYIVMELVEGETIAQRIGSQPMSEEEILVLGRQAAEGLAAAHAGGVLHRDLKPSNLMVSREGRVKILDFGLAKSLEPSPEQERLEPLTASQEVMGTLQYMAPEQLKNAPVDTRCDVHGLGAVLYQMATARRAYPQSTPGALLHALVNERPTPCSELNPRITSELERIIFKALEKDPDLRHQSAAALARDLGAIRLSSPEPITDAPPTLPVTPPTETVAHGPETLDTSTIRLSALAAFRSLKTLPRKRPRSFAASVVLIAVAAVAALWTTRSRPALSFNARDWVLVADFDNQTGEDVFDRSLSAAFTIGLEQSTYANVLSRARVEESLGRMGMDGDATIDEALGRELAIRENLRGLISPTISKIGSRYSIAARLLDPVSGNTVRSYLEVADGQDRILDALDDIAAMIRRDLGESLASISMSRRPLPEVTTASLPALQSYAEGEHLWARGQYDEAVRLHTAAVEEDPDFAMAHAALGVAYYSYIYNDPAMGKKHFERATELSGRVTERERLEIEASFKMNLGYFEQARELYNIYLRAYPDDRRMRYNSGNLLRRMDQPEDAIAQYLEVLRVDPSHGASYINLATTYKTLGRFDESLEAYGKGFDLQPSYLTSGTLNHEYGMVFVLKGDVEGARRVFDIAVSNPDSKARGLRSHAMVDMYLGRFHAASERLEESILVNETKGVPLSVARDLLYLALARRQLGDRDGALRRLDEAAALAADIEAPQAWLWALVGVAYAREEAIEDANRLLALVRSQTDTDSLQQRHDVHRLEGEVALASHRAEEALDVLLLAAEEHSSALIEEALARAFVATGDLEAAMERYQSVIDMRDRSIGWEAQFSWLDAHVGLARIHASRGRREEANALTSVVANLWSDADDSELPLLREIESIGAGTLDTASP